MGGQHHAEHEGLTLLAEVERDGLTGQWHRRQPQNAHDRAEGVEQHAAGRDDHHRHHQRGAAQIDQHQQLRRVTAAAPGTEQDGAGDIERADDRQRVAGHVQGQAAGDHEIGQVGGDEGDVHAADEEAAGERQKASVLQQRTLARDILRRCLTAGRRATQ